MTMVEAVTCVPPLTAVNQPLNSYPSRVGVGNVSKAFLWNTDTVVPPTPPLASKVMVQVGGSSSSGSRPGSPSAYRHTLAKNAPAACFGRTVTAMEPLAEALISETTFFDENAFSRKEYAPCTLKTDSRLAGIASAPIKAPLTDTSKESPPSYVGVGEPMVTSSFRKSRSTSPFAPIAYENHARAELFTVWWSSPLAFIHVRNRSYFALSDKCALSRISSTAPANAFVTSESDAASGSGSTDIHVTPSSQAQSIPCVAPLSFLRYIHLSTCSPPLTIE